MKNAKYSESTIKEANKQFSHLKYGTLEITPEDEFVSMLEKSIDSNIPLNVKCGIDPTATDVHLGHLVPYRKMRQFQDLGHNGIVIIGDYTASIGDPTGKDESRATLSLEQVSKNAEKYLDQVYTVLDKNKTEVKFQSEWFSKVSLRDVITWASQTTVAKLLGHETFSKRLESGLPLSLHEIFYPVLQGIDSVFVKADVELGGSDQKFNVLMGRDYLKNAGLRPQVAMLLPIVTGLCGTQKMSKSLNNYIGILDDPFDKFGKIMSIPDSIMVEYYKYLADFSKEQVENIQNGLDSGKIHPNIAKKDLAQIIVKFFHGEETSILMREKFESVFTKKNAPEDTPEFTFSRGESLIDILLKASMISSKSDGRRLIKQNAIGVIYGAKFSDTEVKLDESFSGKTIKIGKRKFLKLI